MNEIYIFLLFILTEMSIGILTGRRIAILFDIFRILRKSFKTIDFITYIQDFLFWLLAGAILLYSIFSFNNGELRGYIFIGVILGIILYMLILSKYFVKISVAIINILKKIIYTPIKFIINFIKKHIIEHFIKIVNKIKTILGNFKYNKKKEMK